MDDMERDLGDEYGWKQVIQYISCREAKTQLCGMIIKPCRGHTVCVLYIMYCTCA